MMKSQKGYSLIEIGVGLLILTVFLICSVALFNGCYNTYRMIQQRNVAVNYAVSAMEDMLQTDADVLTGFFTEVYDENSKKYNLHANPTFSEFVKENFNDELKARYEQINQIDLAADANLSNEQLERYIYDDKNYLIGLYIKDVVQNMSLADYNSKAVIEGDYALLAPSVIFEGSQMVLEEESISGDYAMFLPVIGSGDQVIIPDNENNMIIKKTIARLPINDNREAFGNQVLKLKVEVFFTNRVNNNGATEKDLRSVKIESIKVASNS